MFIVSHATGGEVYPDKGRHFIILTDSLSVGGFGVKEVIAGMHRQDACLRRITAVSPGSVSPALQRVGQVGRLHNASGRLGMRGCVRVAPESRKHWASALRYHSWERGLMKVVEPRRRGACALRGRGRPPAPGIPAMLPGMNAGKRTRGNRTGRRSAMGLIGWCSKCKRAVEALRNTKWEPMVGEWKCPTCGGAVK